MRGGGKTSLAHLSCVGKDRHKEVTVVFFELLGRGSLDQTIP